MSEHCTDLKGDRKMGAYWERQFCMLAREREFMFTPMQIGRNGSALAYKGKPWNKFTLPDVTIWTAPGQHHEIKHKEPTAHDSYGLEQYRFDALLAFAEETRQDVLYTIHDHSLAGGKNVTDNRIGDWMTVLITELGNNWNWAGPGWSWVDGVKTRVQMYYWSTALWYPLEDYWYTTMTEEAAIPF